MARIATAILVALRRQFRESRESRLCVRQASLPLCVCVCLVGFCAIEGLVLYDWVDVLANLGAFGSVLRFRC